MTVNLADDIINENGGMRMSSLWVNDYIRIMESCEGNFTDYITELSLKNKIPKRFTVLMLGIFCEENPYGYVEMWLENLGMDGLTRRNRSDALFIFSYEALKNTPAAERQARFIGYLNSYFEWQEKQSGEVKEKNAYPEVKTLGELYARLQRNSSESPSGTMNTVKTDKAAEDMLKKIIEDGGGVSEYLDYLRNDEAIGDYNRKATLYIQKMLYGMLKRPLDLICEHNLPEDEELKKSYLDARSLVLENKLAFDRFVKYNKLFIKNTDDGFRKFAASKKAVRVTECIEYLKDKPIAYNRLFTDFYYFITGKKYGSVEDIMTREGKERGYEETELPEDVYINIFGDCIQCDNKIITFLKRAVSGSVYISRSFLILFGLYSGFNAEKLNKALSESGFDELSENNKLDKSVMEIMEYEITDALRDTVNTVNFLNRIIPSAEGKAESIYEDAPDIGEEERAAYNEGIQDVKQILNFAGYIADGDDRRLRDIFSSVPTRKRIAELSDTAVGKLSRMRH